MEQIKQQVLSIADFLENTGTMPNFPNLEEYTALRKELGLTPPRVDCGTCRRNQIRETAKAIREKM